MLNYRQNTSVLIKFDLKKVHYFLHQICLRLLAFFDIWTSHDENLWIKQVNVIDTYIQNFKTKQAFVK
jgi:hypothetical protein